MLDSQIVGDAMQMVVCTLRPGQVLYAEAGKFLFRSADVVMETQLSQPSSQQGGGGFGGLGLFVGLMLLLGPRGVVLSLGIVACILAAISHRRAVAPSERSGALGAFLLAAVTSVIGVLVAGR